MKVLREQNNGYVRLDGSMNPLPIISAFVGSPEVYWFRAAFPASAMSFKIANSGNSGYYDPIAMQYHSVRDLWRVYVSRSYFIRRCETEYKVTAIDEYGNRHVCGVGRLRVFSGVVPDADDGEVTQEDCYVYFPDGKWRKVTVITDALGNATFSVAQDGVTPPDGSFYSQPFALNMANEQFYAITGFVDDQGEAYLSVSDSPANGGKTTYAKDANGFYHRIETTTDDVGQMTANVGEKR